MIYKKIKFKASKLLLTMSKKTNSLFNSQNKKFETPQHLPPLTILL